MTHICIIIIIIIIIIVVVIIIIIIVNFSNQLTLVVIDWSLSDSKFSRRSRTLPSVRRDLNNAVVWMISILSPISSSSCLFSKPLATVTSAPTTISITVTFMFPVKIYVLVYFFAFFYCHFMVRRGGKIQSITFFLLMNTGFGLLVGIR